MATWTKNKVNASDVNSGNQFNAGDGVRNTDINKVFESGLYSQDMVENISIGTVTTSASGGNANASVTYNQTTGYPQINLTLPRGEKGDKGDSGDVGTIAELIYNGATTSSGSTMNTPSFTPSKYLVTFHETGHAGISGSIIIDDTSYEKIIPYSYCSQAISNELTIMYITIKISFINGNKIRCTADYVDTYYHKYDDSWSWDTYTTNYPTIKVYALKI